MIEGLKFERGVAGRYAHFFYAGRVFKASVLVGGAVVVEECTEDGMPVRDGMSDVLESVDHLHVEFDGGRGLTSAREVVEAMNRWDAHCADCGGDDGEHADECHSELEASFERSVRS